MVFCYTHCSFQEKPAALLSWWLGWCKLVPLKDSLLASVSNFFRLAQEKWQPICWSHAESAALEWHASIDEMLHCQDSRRLVLLPSSYCFVGQLAQNVSICSFLFCVCSSAFASAMGDQSSVNSTLQLDIQFSEDHYNCCNHPVGLFYFQNSLPQNYGIHMNPEPPGNNKASCKGVIRFVTDNYSNLKIKSLGGGFIVFLSSSPTWAKFPFWRAYFSDGLVQPPSRISWRLSQLNDVVQRLGPVPEAAERLALEACECRCQAQGGCQCGLLHLQHPTEL